MLLKKIIYHLRRPDIKYCYLNLHPTGKVFFRDAVLCLLAKSLNNKVILHIHGRGIPRKQSIFRRYIYQTTFKNTKVIHLSDIFFDELSSFVERLDFTSVPNCTEDLYALSKIRTGKKIKFYYLSNYIKGKGALELLNAAKHIYHENINCTFVFAGGWFDSNFKGEIHAWKEENKSLFNSGYIEIHGPLHGEKKHELIRDSDVFIFPSYIDTFPLVVLEALSAGKLIISTSTGAVPEMLDHGKVGIIVPQQNHLALADQISHVIRHPEIIKAYSISARKRYLECYTEEKFQRNFMSAINNITSQPKI